MVYHLKITLPGAEQKAMNKVDTHNQRIAKLIFAAAIKANACGIILAHNHPSGNLQSSQADIDLTKKMKEGGKLLEIQKQLINAKKKLQPRTQKLRWH